MEEKQNKDLEAQGAEESKDYSEEQLAKDYAEALGVSVDKALEALDTEVGNVGIPIDKTFTVTGRKIVVRPKEGQSFTPYIAYETVEGTPLSVKRIMGLTAWTNYDFTDGACHQSSHRNGKNELVLDNVYCRVSKNFTDASQLYVCGTRNVKEAVFNPAFALPANSVMQFLGNAVMDTKARKNTTNNTFANHLIDDPIAISQQMWCKIG